MLFDNRSRIGTRIRQLKTGRRHSQNPVSNICRLMTNIEVLGTHATDTVVAAAMLTIESRDRGTTVWAGRCEYRLRRIDEELRMSFKKILLVDRDRPLNTLSFLI